jgi:hypothetical protein
MKKKENQALPPFRDSGLKTVDITKKNNGHFDRENRGQLGNRGQDKSQLH